MSVGLLAVVLIVIAAATAMFWPLRTAHAPRVRAEGDRPLEVARDSKLGEINDLELDFRLGKLSTDDYHALNATLRSEAVEIMRRIDASAEAGRNARAGRGES